MWERMREGVVEGEDLSEKIPGFCRQTQGRLHRLYCLAAAFSLL